MLLTLCAFLLTTTRVEAGVESKRLVLQFAKIDVPVSHGAEHRRLETHLETEGVMLSFPPHLNSRRRLSLKAADSPLAEKDAAIEHLRHLELDILHLHDDEKLSSADICSKIKAHSPHLEKCAGDQKLYGTPERRSAPFSLDESNQYTLDVLGDEVMPFSRSNKKKDTKEKVARVTTQSSAGDDSDDEDADVVTHPSSSHFENLDVNPSPTPPPNDPGYFEQWGLLAPSRHTYGVNVPGAWNVLYEGLETAKAQEAERLKRQNNSTGAWSESLVKRLEDGELPRARIMEESTPDGAEHAHTIDVSDFHPLIAVIDSGADYTHQDLAGALWTNEAELHGEPGVDDDGNGYVDDIYGYDFRNDDGDPMDDDGHGTHVTGIIAANGNNGKGIAGVAWAARPKVMALKFMGRDPSDPHVTTGWTSDAIRALDYAIQMEAHITCNSWGGGPYDWGLEKAIQKSADIQQLFVVAAGNEQLDLDMAPQFPAGFAEQIRNVVNVASTNRKGGMLFDSNYGLRTVHLGAPGERILSTVLDGKYAYYSGTSMAAPFVAGTAAMVLQLHPDLINDFESLRMILLETVAPLEALGNKTITGGQLNAKAALEQAVARKGELDCFLPQTDFWGFDVEDDSAMLAWNDEALLERTMMEDDSLLADARRTRDGTDNARATSSHANYRERNPHSCQLLCQQNINCEFWTFNSFHQCWLKIEGASTNKIYSHGSIAGPKYCVRNENNLPLVGRKKATSSSAEIDHYSALSTLPVAAMQVPGCFEVHVARGGVRPQDARHLLPRKSATTPNTCLLACLEDPFCKMWSFHPPSQSAKPDNLGLVDPSEYLKLWEAPPPAPRSEPNTTDSRCFVAYKALPRSPIPRAVSGMRPRPECAEMRQQEAQLEDLSTGQSTSVAQRLALPNVPFPEPPLLASAPLPPWRRWGRSLATLGVSQALGSPDLESRTSITVEGLIIAFIGSILFFVLCTSLMIMRRSKTMRAYRDTMAGSSSKYVSPINSPGASLYRGGRSLTRRDASNRCQLVEA